MEMKRACSYCGNVWFVKGRPAAGRASSLVMFGVFAAPSYVAAKRDSRCPQCRSATFVETPAPQWLPNPNGSGFRWWAGEEWTEHTSETWGS
jgi:DNA-directed RNA polymerase subunit RPC12/RpoP